jgi:sulfur carrier protein
MNIYINGQAFDTDQTQLAAVLVEFAAKPPFAIALNGDFVAQNDYANTALTSDDKLDIVSPIYGG